MGTDNTLQSNATLSYVGDSVMQFLWWQQIYILNSMLHWSAMVADTPR